MNTTTVTQTPALTLADVLADITSHLRDHPHLPVVELARGGLRKVYGLQIATQLSEGWDDGDAIIAWARSLPDMTIEAKRYPIGICTTGRDVSISLYATLGDTKVRVWSAFNAGDDFGLAPNQTRALSFEELHDALSST